MQEIPLITQLSMRGKLSEAEKSALTKAVGGTRHVAHNTDMIRQGDSPRESTFVLNGFAARYKDLENGSRQIVAIHVKGDFVDLHSFLLKRMDHGITALTPCHVAWIPHEHIQEITERFPNLTRLLWLTTLVDAVTHREWIVDLGRKTAASNIAHLICELFVRLTAIGETDGTKFRLPITQEELADARGMSIVHLNRSLQLLRSQGLISWHGETVIIKDWFALSDLAEFDASYLSFDPSLSPERLRQSSLQAVPKA
jgi:CRP-like cAMP-binding protein